MGDGSPNFICRPLIVYTVTIYLYLFSTFTHRCLIASAIELMFLRAIPGDVVNEDEADITLPIMMNTIPPNACLPSDVVVNFSVTGGTATSKNTIVYACGYNSITYYHLQHRKT